MEEINKRFDRIEERLFDIEKALGLTLNKYDNSEEVEPNSQSQSQSQISGLDIKQDGEPVSQSSNPWLSESDSVKSVRKNKTSNSNLHAPVSATSIMAWCAGAMFILAAVYFLKLIYDTGWLTPVRQIAIAYVISGGLVSVGFFVKKHDRQYAAYLPAVGLVVLYLTTFIGHMYYGLYNSGLAMGLLGVTTLLGIWLGRAFNNSIYVIFAAVGIYISPLFVHSKDPQLIDLVIYYSAWSLLFSFCSIQENRRITYLLPMYLAILGFDFICRMSGETAWQVMAIYQLLQFLIFGLTAVFFSVKHKTPIAEDTYFAHGLALFIFYGIEYAILEKHIPDLVNYFALGSGVIVWVLYLLASRMLNNEQALTQGASLVSYYCSWVVVHAIFFGEVKEYMLPWAVLVSPLILYFANKKLHSNRKALMPIKLACSGLFLMGYGMVLMNILLDVKTSTPMPSAALLVYVVLLYGAYFVLSKKEKKINNISLMLYAGHLGVMACLIDWVEKDIYLSSLWAVYGVALLVLSLAMKDKVVGKSALIIFSAAAFKVLLFDLSGAESMVRVVVLLILSASLYVGGYLYQSVVREADAQALS